MQNTVTRKISPESPLYIPFAANVGFLLITGILYLFNATDPPSTKVASNTSNTKVVSNTKVT